MVAMQAISSVSPAAIERVAARSENGLEAGICWKRPLGEQQLPRTGGLKMTPAKIIRQKSLQHLLFPGGHPSRY